MRKIFLFLVLLSCLTLSGCSYAKGDRQFMVSSVGFSTDGVNITVTTEVIVINSESSETDPTPQVLSGTGTTISEAFDEIGATLAKPMLLEHCGVIVIGKKMTPLWFKKICDYCFSENRITLSAYMISAKDPYALLSGEPESSVAVGYDLMGIIEQQASRTGILYENRYFEVEGKREKGEKTFSLPHFVRKDEAVTLDGISLFKSDKEVYFLDNRDAGIYALMTGNYGNGRVRCGSSEYDVTSRRTEYDYRDSEKNEIILKLTITGDKIDKTACQRLEREIETLESKLRSTLKSDALGLTDALSVRYSRFNENHGKSEKFYNSAHFSVECRPSKEK